jgi:hypothetical protein
MTFPQTWTGPHWKGKPQQLARDEKRRADEARDAAESRKVKRRSKGRCEVTVGRVRCKRRAFEVHHHIGGWGLRGRGDSALAKHKTHACVCCHRQITGNVLEHIRGNHYRRVSC